MKVASYVRANVSRDGLVLLHVHQGQIFSANHIGARIWQLLEQGLDADAIAQTIATETGAPLPTVTSDVQDFLASLKREAILQDA